MVSLLSFAIKLERNSRGEPAESLQILREVFLTVDVSKYGDPRAAAADSNFARVVEIGFVGDSGGQDASPGLPGAAGEEDEPVIDSD